MTALHAFSSGIAQLDARRTLTKALQLFGCLMKLKLLQFDSFASFHCFTTIITIRIFVIAREEYRCSLHKRIGRKIRICWTVRIVAPLLVILFARYSPVWLHLLWTVRLGH